MTDILSRIDDTLTFHSAGLGADLEVSVERPGIDLSALIEPYGETIVGLQQASFQVAGHFDGGWTLAVPTARTVEISGIPGTVGTFRAMGEVLPGPAEYEFSIQFSYPDNKRFRRWLDAAGRRARLRHIHHLYRQRRRKW